ncbi:excinuclease ABC subunit UvrC [Malacoplasma muris]|uniref:excinuclease ABC subunit UvrC n=1 Tax=Malacoplasma muris TaxID=2119 RepID=UPI00398E50CA
MTDLEKKLKSVPKLPGCYLWKDKNGVIIYIGKAKNLYNRTHQYFNSKKDPKTFKLVQEIYDLDYVIVNNENESLLLENNLIGKYKPKYNILLRESNTFPYIVVTKEEHPRILYSHDNKRKIRGTYYGPFATTKKYELYNFINRIFPLRKCRTLPNQKCIYYDIGQCLGPCINKITKNDYEPYLKRINDFFSGKYHELDESLKKEELSSAEKLNFEMSKEYFDLRNSLKSFSLKQDIISSKNNDEDVIGFAIKENIIAIVIFKYANGFLISKYDIFTVFYLSSDEIVESLVFDYYSNLAIEKPKNVYLSLDNSILNNLSLSLKINFINPTKGSKKDIMLTALTNANELMKSKYLTAVSNLSRESNALQQLQDLIGVDSTYIIEMFDNSNIFNDDKVSAMVVYENGKKNKNLYRKFNIKNLESNSDYEYMEEVIFRRYKLVIDSKNSLPNLIIVDGGKPQVSAALKSLKKLHIDSVVPVIGLAKDDKHKTDRIVKSDLTEIKLDKTSELYFFLLNMQDEVHRFAITFHRSKRSKSLFKTTLNEINNLGKKRIEKLLLKFETIEKIKEASVDELSQVVPRKIAIEIKNKLKI